MDRRAEISEAEYCLVWNVFIGSMVGTAHLRTLYSTFTGGMARVCRMQNLTLFVQI